MFNIKEEISRKDKSEIKKMIKDELEKEMKARLNKAVREELEKELGNSATKQQIADISKNILKKLYRALSLQHPHIIDRLSL